MIVTFIPGGWPVAVQWTFEGIELSVSLVMSLRPHRRLSLVFLLL